MPAAVEMDCLIALSPVPSSEPLTPPVSPGEGQRECSMTITNLDPSWPGATLKAYPRDGGRWEVQGGTGKRGDWVAYLGSAWDVSHDDRLFRVVPGQRDEMGKGLTLNNSATKADIL